MLTLFGEKSFTLNSCRRKKGGQLAQSIILLVLLFHPPVSDCLGKSSVRHGLCFNDASQNGVVGGKMENVDTCVCDVVFGIYMVDFVINDGVIPYC